MTQRPLHFADRLGHELEWLPDVAALHRPLVFEGSPLGEASTRELRRRLDVLARIDGGVPRAVDGVTHYGYGNGGGDTVNAWLRADGSGLLLTFDHESDLNGYEEPAQNAALYAGVPSDLLTLVRDIDETATTLNAAHPDGGTLVAATGVFVCGVGVAMSEGLEERLRADDVPLSATGVGWLVDAFLAEEFSAEEVADTTAWWSPDRIEAAFELAATGETWTALAAEDAAIERFCRIWADSGYNEYDGDDTYYVLFDSTAANDVDAAEREDLLATIGELGLERVATPADSESGEVWVRVDPRIDDELENWA